MKIKQLKCSCGAADLTFISSDFGKTVGIYCKKCGRFVKWASKSEKKIWIDNREAKE